ncbi:MAG: nucleotide exchange factor GrpE [Deltaproteobacteria bacterium]|jgi:molecular chaperone GrpE|nr:nucleotide exchange factor GrpE [Deltaproteobacteria bacterium]
MDDKDKQPVEIDLTDPETSPTPATPADPPEETAAGDGGAPVPPTPEERIAGLETEKAELRERMLRIAADFDNWKKRSRRDLADGEMRARESVLRDFLEIADNLERATASFAEHRENDVKSIRDGVDLVLRQFRSKLERYQVKAVESVGQPFDPRVHEAVAQVPTADVKPGSIVHELQKGYLIGDRLLRPALVAVAAAPPPPAETPAPAEESPAQDPPPGRPGEG